MTLQFVLLLFPLKIKRNKIYFDSAKFQTLPNSKLKTILNPREIVRNQILFERKNYLHFFHSTSSRSNRSFSIFILKPFYDDLNRLDWSISLNNKNETFFANCFARNLTNINGVGGICNIPERSLNLWALSQMNCCNKYNYFVSMSVYLHIGRDIFCVYH